MSLFLLKIVAAFFGLLLALTLAMPLAGRGIAHHALAYLSIERGIGIIDVGRRSTAWLVADPTATSPGAWSPDGERLAYTAQGDDTGQIDLIVTGVGGGTMRLTDSPYDEFAPAWSPDGRMLAYVTEELEGSDYLGRQQVIRVLDMETGAVLDHLTQPTGLNALQGWSPDGQILTYITQESGAGSYRAQIRFTDVATGERLPELTQSEGRYSEVSWSPDSRWFTYTSQAVESTAIYLGERETGGVRLLSKRAITAPAWSPDSQHLAYTALDYSTGRSRSALFLWDVRGGETRRLTDHPGSDWFKAWSPDGQQIVVESNRDGARRLYSISMATGAAQLLSPTPYLAAALSWSPDGRWLAFSSGQTQNVDVYVMDMESYSVTRLTHTATSTAPHWQPS